MECHEVYIGLIFWNLTAKQISANGMPTKPRHQHSKDTNCSLHSRWETSRNIWNLRITTCPKILRYRTQKSLVQFFWYFNISQSILKHTSLQLRFWNSRYARKFWRKFRDSNPSAITSHGPKHQLTKKTSTLGTSATTPRRFTKNPPPPPEFSASKCQGGRDGAKAKILIARWQESLNHLFANVQGGCVTFFLGYLKGWLVNV